MSIKIIIRRSFINKCKQLLIGAVAITVLATLVLNIRVAGIDQDGKYFQTNTIMENIREGN